MSDRHILLTCQYIQIAHSHNDETRIGGWWGAIPSTPMVQKLHFLRHKSKKIQDILTFAY